MTQADIESILAAIKELKDDVRADVKGVQERLDRLNSRTRKVETGLAVQWVLWCIAGAVLLATLNELLALVVSKVT